MRYLSSGFRPIERSVEVWSAERAAIIFAARLARRWWGKNAYCRTIRAEAWSDGYVEYSAFIGVDRPEFGQRVTVGKNVRITVTSA